MNFIIDDKIPYIKGVLEPFATVKYVAGSLIDSQVIKNADALIVRTRTKCDETLLSGSSVRVIGSATIGIDHIDTAYCRKNNINWINAPGCNADSVCQYIASALFVYATNKKNDITKQNIGIVGVGNVGKRVARFCETIGMKVLLNDPPRQEVEKTTDFVSLQEIQEKADIITFHVPLTTKGKHKTHHLVDNRFVKALKKQPLLINSARGEVFSADAIKKGLTNRLISDVIIDCWENEPNIDLQLLEKSLYGTPHIAGYSRDGKANATKAIVRAISRFFDLGIDNWQPKQLETPQNPIININGNSHFEHSIFAQAVLATYNIKTDSETLKNMPDNFEAFRGSYPPRREFNAYTVHAQSVSPSTLQRLSELGFGVKEKGGK